MLSWKAKKRIQKKKSEIKRITGLKHGYYHLMKYGDIKRMEIPLNYNTVKLIIL